MRGYYDILGLGPGASSREIERQYRRLAKRLHPDLHPGIDPERMEAVNEAWEVLGDPYRRALYDRRLRAHARQPATVTESDIGDATLEQRGFREWRGWVPRVVSSGRNLWARDVSSLEPLLDAAPGSVWGLHLAGCPIRDDALAVLPGLPGLRLLDLADTGVTDVGLDAVADCAGLEDLSLWNTAVTDAGMAALRDLRLTNLNVGHTAITDAGVRTIAAMGSLHFINLRATPVTADGLLALASLPDLGMLAPPPLHWRDRWRLSRVLGRDVLL